MKNPLITRNTPRWSDNDIARLRYARAAKRAAKTRAIQQAVKKRWKEVDEPGKRRIAVLLAYLLDKFPKSIQLRWNPTRNTGRKLMHGAEYATLLRVIDGWLLEVQIEGYKRPQRFHPSYWEILLP